MFHIARRSRLVPIAILLGLCSGQASRSEPPNTESQTPQNDASPIRPESDATTDSDEARLERIEESLTRLDAQARALRNSDSLKDLRAQLSVVETTLNEVTDATKRLEQVPPQLANVNQSLTDLKQKLVSIANLDFPEGTKKQLADILAVVKETQTAINRSSKVDQDLKTVQATLDDIQDDIQPSIFDDIWRSYVTSVVWEFFGIKRGSDDKANFLGRVFSSLGVLLGIVVAALKIKYWWKRNASAAPKSAMSPASKAFEAVWFIYAIVLAVAFCGLSWVAARVQTPPEAIRFREDVQAVSDRIEVLGNLPSSLQQIDERLARLEDRPESPAKDVADELSRIENDLAIIKEDVSELHPGFFNFFWQILKFALLLVGVFGCVVFGIDFYKRHLTDNVP